MIMTKEFIREIKGHKYKYLIYWDKAEKKPKQKYLGRVDVKKSPSGDLTFDGVQNTYLISPVLGSYASP